MDVALSYWDLILELLLLGVGICLLLKGGDYLIDGASDLSLSFGISPLIVGMSVVAFGTSLPEFLVSFLDLMRGSDGIAIGNVIGSNIANIGLVLGMAALINFISISKKAISVDIPLVLAISIFSYIMMIDGVINIIDGIIFCVIFLIYIVYIYLSGKLKYQNAYLKNNSTKYKLKSFLFIVLGILGLYIGANITINSCKAIAYYFGVSELGIGLTIVSIGTSLPELVTTIRAISKDKHDIGVGNIIGSNIFNLLFVLGVNALVTDIKVSVSTIYYWGPIMLSVTLILYVLAKIKKQLKFQDGIILISIYLLYIFWVVFY